MAANTILQNSSAYEQELSLELWSRKTSYGMAPQGLPLAQCVQGLPRRNSLISAPAASTTSPHVSSTASIMLDGQELGLVRKFPNWFYPLKKAGLPESALSLASSPGPGSLDPAS